MIDNISLFLLRFNPTFTYVGRSYLHDIINLVVEAQENNFSLSYSEAVKKVAAEKFIDAGSLLAAISRWVNSSWALEFVRNDWELILGWKEKRPPSAREAIKLFCDYVLMALK